MVRRGVTTVVLVLVVLVMLVVVVVVVVAVVLVLGLDFIGIISLPARAHVGPQYFEIEAFLGDWGVLIDCHTLLFLGGVTGLLQSVTMVSQ
jgi:hypothetical protein